MQRDLNVHLRRQHGDPIPVDGEWGDATERAFRAVCHRLGIEPRREPPTFRLIAGALAPPAAEGDREKIELLEDDELDALLDEELDELETADSLEERLGRLEAAAAALAAAEERREAARVRRKVWAAGVGALWGGGIPAALEALGAYDVATGTQSVLVLAAAAAGAFLTGWLTPERRSYLD